MLMNKPYGRTNPILQADLLSQGGCTEVIRGMGQDFLDDGDQPAGGQLVSGRSRRSQAQMMDAACPEGLIGRERDGRAWNARTDGRAGRSCTPVMKDEAHARE